MCRGIVAALAAAIRRCPRAAGLSVVMHPVVVALAVLAAGATVAGASTQSVFSQPNREVYASVSIGCQGTNRDKDDDLNTCVGGDTMSIHFAAGNNTDAEQTIRIEYVFDGPGTELDRTFTDEVTLPARDFVQSLEGIRVQNGKTPLGGYTQTVTVTGAAEAATAAGSVTVAAKNGT